MELFARFAVVFAATFLAVMLCNWLKERKGRR